MMHQVLPFLRSQFVFQAQGTFSGGGDVGDVGKGTWERILGRHSRLYDPWIKSAVGLQGSNRFWRIARIE